MSWLIALLLFPALAALGVAVSIVRERDLAVRGLRIPLYTGAAFLAEAPLDDGAVVPEFALAAAELDREEPRAITV
jgi:hypothetical protein